MNKFLISIILAVVCLLSLSSGKSTGNFNAHGINLGIVTVYGVSTSIKELKYEPKGSIAGGTTVYISCSGQDMISTKNKVMIGPYECIIPEKGVTANTISCVTSQAHDENLRANLPIELFVEGKQQSQCKGSCQYSYLEDTTPKLRFITPSASAPYRDINWNGLYRVGNTIQIKKMIIGNDKNGEFNCNRFQLRDVSPGDHINLNDNQAIKNQKWIDVPCTVAQEQVAGLYDVNAEIKWGSPVYENSMNMYTREGQRQYQFAITPEIINISQNSAGSQGSLLTIQGRGFGFLKDEVQVNAGDLDCEIQSINNEEIICQVEAGTTESEQAGQFIKGQGAIVSYYQASNQTTGITLADKVRDGTAVSSELKESEQIGSWEVSGIPSKTGAQVSGYFYAPRTGNYNFWGAADDRLAVYLNKTPMTQSTTAEDLVLERCDKSQQRSYFSPPTSCQYRSNDIYLEEGNYYWLEVYGVNIFEEGHLTLSVETPSIDNYQPKNQLPAILKYSLVPEIDTQIWSIKVWGVDTAYGIKFFSRNEDNDVDWDEKTVEKSWNEWDAETFKEQIAEATGGFDPQVQQFSLNASGKRCENCEAKGKEFVVEFLEYRTPENKNANPKFTKNIKNSNSSITLKQEQFSGISGGYYTMKLNNNFVEVYSNDAWTTNIPFDADNSMIKQGLQRLTGVKSISVEQKGDVDVGIERFITLTSEDGQFNSQQKLKFQNFLEGVKPGTQPEITKSVVQQTSDRLFFEPITFDFIFQAADLPSVVVTVDGIPSTVDFGVDNSYLAVTGNTPVINSYSLSGQVLTLALSEGSISFDNSQVQVTYGFAKCGAFNGNSCTLQTAIEGGEHQPIVYVQQVGYATIDDSFTPPSGSQSVVVSSVSPNTASIYGGIEVTLNGSGFSSSSDRAQVKIGESVAQIQSISPTQIVVKLPVAQGNTDSPQTITVEINGSQNTNKRFTYTNQGIPTISEISPSKASPVQKGTVTITGTNFGNNEDNVKVQLFKADAEEYSYDLYLQSVSNTEIVATLSGGRVGDYKLKVFKSGKGYSLVALDFSYKIEIHNVQPRQGSSLGGTVLTITGQNFSTTATDNLVFLTQAQEEVNDICTILTASATEITCVTPPKNVEFEESEPMLVYVQGRLIEESVCGQNGTCDFYYSSSATPSLDEQNSAYLASENTITVTGSGFIQGNSATLKFTPEISVEGTVISATEIQFETPDIVAGEYGALVSIDNIGYAGIFLIKFEVSIDSFEPQTISNAGGILNIIGKGFDSNAFITVGNKECEIISQSVTNIQCIAPLRGVNTYPIKLEQGGVESTVFTTETTVQYVRSSSTEFRDSTQTQFLADNIVIELGDTDALDEDQSAVSTYLYKQDDLARQFQGVYADSQLVFNQEIPIGKYRLVIALQEKGFVNIDGDINPKYIEIVQNLSIEETTTGLFGGNMLEINGEGFDLTYLNNNDIKVCGYACVPKESSTYNQVQCELPVVNTQYLKNKNQQFPENNFELVEKQQTFWEELNGKIPMQMIADNYTEDNFQVLKEDGRIAQYKSASGSSCYVGYDFGDYLRVDIDSIIITTDVTDLQEKQKLYGSKLQVSNDQENWVDILELDSTNLKAYSYLIKFDIEEIPLSQYVRLYNEVDETESAYCGITGFQVSGFNYYRQNIEDSSDFTCDVSVNVNGKQQVLESKVTYTSSSSSTVENISPYYGWQLGGTEVTISGEGFGTDRDAVSVLFDEIECVISSVNDEQIVCTTGDKGADNYSASKVAISVNGINAIVPEGLLFYYGLLWSQDASWGLEAAPRAGDSVFVYSGRTLIIDQSSPKFIDTIINEGRIIFADEDIDFHVRYFINRKSELIIGTEFSTFESNLTLTLHGQKEDRQLPQFGVKVLACHKCKLDIHGLEKTPTWTFIDTTVNPGASQLTTKQSTNWQVGDRLVLATTDFDGKHSEEVFIIQIQNNSDGDVITFSPELQYTHISESEQYGDKTLNMFAELGNLSRNIVIQGNPKDNNLELYGGHVMMHGEGSIARIENVEFTRTGQSMLIGRYTMHFHMVGDCRRSYIKGNSVHHSYARVVALHDVRNLRVERNVSYWVRAHNIFLENGIETDNQIHYNLIVSPRTAFNMLQTDITVAGIWITNPTNYVTYNHVVGSQFYGLWYEIFERPETPNTANDICPEGEPLGATDHNVAHSNERFGLRIFRLAPRKYSCQSIIDVTSKDLWSTNPSIESVYTNHTLYKNGEAGLLAEEVGNTKFQDFILADNYFAGFQAHLTNFTKEEVVLEDSLIVGQSLYTQSLGEEEQEFLKTTTQNAIVVPRTNGFRVRNVEVHNQQKGSNILLVSSINDDIDMGVSGGKQYNIENISIFNSEDAQIVKWVGYKYNIVFDQDGSLTGTELPTYISSYYSHFDQAIEDGKCTHKVEKYDDSVLCTGTRLRSIPIGNLQKPMDFEQQIIKVINLNDQEKADRFGTTEESEEDFVSYRKSMMLSGDTDDYVMIYATDYAYNVHWNSNLDWSHLQIQPSYAALDDDKTVVLRFNYTEQRELFDLFQREGTELTAQYEQVFDESKFYNEDRKPNSSDDGCSLGQYYINYDVQTVSVCINNKGRNNVYQAVDVNGVYCRHSCPKIEYGCEKEAAYKAFDNEQIWADDEGNLPLRKRPEQEEYEYGMPQRGDDVIIPCPWTLAFNVADFEFGTLIVDGTLIIDEGIPHTTITANNIWVRSGKILAGSEQYPYQNKLDIILTGNIYSPPVVIDDRSRTGTKSLAVTGQLELFGKSPAVTQTRLMNQAQVGASQIVVEAETKSWSIGDELVLGGSAIDGSGFEKITISAINEKTITLESPLEFYHYGAEKPTVGNDGSAYVQIDEKYGSGLDMRTVVGHITRNIRIQGTEEDELGGHIQVYHWLVQEETETEIIDIDLRGSMTLSGVELINMGQIDSDNAGIHVLETQITDNSDAQTLVTGSSIHDCFGICVNLINTQNIKFENNVLYNGVKFLIQNLGYKQTTITNNLFVGVVKSPYSQYYEPDTFIYMYESYNPEFDGVRVEGNVGQSSNGAAFVFPSTPCDQREDNGFINNSAGKIRDVGVIYNLSNAGCYMGGYNNIYHAKEGVSVHSKKTTEVGWELENQILIENDTGVIMRSGSQNDYLHHNFLRTTYVSGLILGEICPECYSTEYFRCSDQLGALMLLTNLNGNAPPFKVLPALGLKALCNAPVISSSIYINDCEFSNFREDYSAFNIEQGVCGENKVFTTNKSASEATAAHFLKNTKCTNCEQSAKLYLSEPKADERGWFGGCGVMDCTGQENVMLQDLTGDFLGIVGTAISNNEDIGYGLVEETSEMQETCEFIQAWNGFLCERDDFVQLQWEAIGPDAQIIDTVPVIVRNDYFENTVNMWKEWDWIGPEPQNRRHNSFLSLALVNQRHSITYSGSQSVDIIHKLSQRNQQGEQDRYVIVESSYNSPLTIEVLVDGQLIDPFSFKQPVDLGQHTTECGANNYYYTNSTIHFVVTNVPTCQVQVRQVNHVQINARISLTEDEFFADDNAETTFANRIASFLSIPFDRVRIVGIVQQNRRILEGDDSSNEFEIQVVIKGSTPGTEETNYDGSDDYQELTKLGQQLTDGISNDEVQEILAAEFQVVVIKKAGTGESEEDYFTESDLNQKNSKKSTKVKEKEEEGVNGVAITLGIIFGLLVIILLGLVAYNFYNKRTLQRIKPQEVKDNEEEYQKQQVIISQRSSYQ